MSRMRVGIIGLQNMGTSRAATFSEIAETEVTMLCTRKPDLLEEIAQKYGIDDTTADWRELVAHPKVDAVCICTPNNLHAEMATAALRNGKHALMEYPPAIAMDELEALLALSDGTDAVLHPSRTPLFESQYLAMRKLLPELGEPVEAQGVMSLPRMWQWAVDSEIMGPYFVLANYHQVAYVVDLYGEPEWVVGKLWERLHEGKFTAVYGSILMGYAGGFSAYVSYGMGMPTPRYFNEFRIICSKGTIERLGSELWVNRSEGREFVETPYESSGAILSDSLAFVEDILGDRPKISPREASATAKVCLLAHQSAKQGGRVVKVPCT